MSPLTASLAAALLLACVPAHGAQPVSADDFIRRFNNGAASHYGRHDFARMTLADQHKVRSFLIDGYRRNGDGDRQLDSLRILAYWRDPAVVPLALDALKSSDHLLQKHGAGACWRLAAKTCLPLLRQLVARSSYAAGDPTAEILNRIVRDIEAGRPYRDVDER